jgi:hypothetical protein
VKGRMDKELQKMQKTVKEQQAKMNGQADEIKDLQIKIS